MFDMECPFLANEDLSSTKCSDECALFKAHYPKPSDIGCCVFIQIATVLETIAQSVKTS
ncbi:hypothetical protein FACS1894137_07070 [Spirochaetia bacterium]|nr:hypothetical protein FACS1894137_07070 [Spirochaetia bacterium]